MSLSVVALVLAAALMHAAWNALIKSSRDIALNTAMVACTSSIAAALLLPLVPLPAPASWPYLLASCVVELVYFRLLAAVYHHGDLSYTYPLMRGLAPPLVAAAGAVVLSDHASPFLWAGVALISLGVLWIGASRRLLARAPTRATGLAVANACVIAAYTLIDGIGVRHSGNSVSYGLWLFFLIGVPIVPMILWRRGRSLAIHLRRDWWRGLCGGLLNIGVYLIVLWAMTRAPIAAVAAVRETSVIFGALIGSLLLKEPFGRRRIVGACLIVVGIGLLRG